MITIENGDIETLNQGEYASTLVQAWPGPTKNPPSPSGRRAAGRAIVLNCVFGLPRPGPAQQSGQPFSAQA
jgi:hypothetical protein